MRRARFIILAFPKRSKYDPPWHLPEWQDALGRAAQDVAVQEETKIFAEMQESICNATLIPKHLTGFLTVGAKSVKIYKNPKNLV